MPPTHDVFISYCHNDGDWVKAFAERLGKEGINVAYDQILLQPGDRIVHGIEEGILHSAHGLGVYSPSARASRWVSEEYQALMGRSIIGGNRFIPVLIENVELPLFAQGRNYLDFRNTADGSPGYDQLVGQLVQALRS